MTMLGEHEGEFAVTAATSADAVLRAAFTILVTEGLGEITPTRLHAMTGVARTTIYRHWPEPDDMLADILTRAVRHQEPAETTGDLATDLRAAIEEVLGRLSNGPVRQLLAALMTSDSRNTTRNRLAPTYVSALAKPLADVLDTAIEHGHISGDAAHITADVMGPLLLRIVIYGEDCSTLSADDVLRSGAIADRLTGGQLRATADV